MFKMSPITDRAAAWNVMVVTQGSSGFWGAKLRYRGLAKNT